MYAAQNQNRIILVIVCLLLTAGCTRPSRTPETSSTQLPPTLTPFVPSPSSGSSTPTPTPFSPIPTAAPAAAVVNGDLITVVEYQEELSRYKAAVNRDLTPEDQQIVINELINLTLLAQAANAEGFQISDSDLDGHIAALDTEGVSLGDWLAANGFTQNSFRSYLRRSLEAAWMRDQIIANVPTEMDQIHAQQMLFYDLASAQAMMEYIQEGRDFDQLASVVDPQTRGDLGWFPEGILTIPELDPILASLEVGQTSDIIETEIGYHIIKVLDKQSDRPLNPAIRQILQEKALEDWIDSRRESSTIEITLPA